MSGAEPLFRVLFVCTGNTCRSPLAAAALKRALGAEAARVEIGSAGTGAFEGAPPSANAVRAADRDGLDLTGHRSRRLDRALLAGVDLVLLMDPRDLPQVKALDPEAAAQTYGLADFAKASPTGEAIPDPYGGSPEAYEECLRRIESHLERVAPYVRAALEERAADAKKPS
jgi:protein-tyrosine-phosphatase